MILMRLLLPGVSGCSGTVSDGVHWWGCGTRRRSGTVASIDGRLGQAVVMRCSRYRPPAPRSSFAGFRFPPEVITIAVRWYLRCALSYRDVEELLAERGIAVDHVPSTAGCSGLPRC